MSLVLFYVHYEAICQYAEVLNHHSSVTIVPRNTISVSIHVVMVKESNGTIFNYLYY